MAASGVELRMGILREAASQLLLKPLTSHGWSSSITHAAEAGEYLIINAEKDGHSRTVALMYSSATANEHYKRIDQIASNIFINGQPYQVESFAYGISATVAPISEFFSILVQWNKELNPTANFKQRTRPTNIRRIVSENPLSGIWSEIGQFSSLELAKKLIKRRAQAEQIPLTDEQLNSKASGVSFSVSNAIDYFKGAPNESLNKRVLSLYYGTLNLAFAEMLSSPKGPTDLDEVEGMTKYGHGLFALASDTGSFSDLTIGVIASGFFPQWISFLGYDTSTYPKSKAKTSSDLENHKKHPPESFASMAKLLSSIPEVGHLFMQVYDNEPSWLTPHFDSSSMIHRCEKPPSSSYIFLSSHYRKISQASILAQNWPFAELTEVESETDQSRYRVRIDHPGLQYWHEALLLHKSPYLQSSALVMPVIGGVNDYRAVALAILYALSILVRYMPGSWRRVEGGDWDQHLSVMRATLDVFERLLPQEFLESITNERILTSLPGSLT